MASITASASQTLVSMLGAVNVTANTLARSVHTTANALDMLDQYVQDARIEQIARSQLSRASMLQRIQEEAALDAASRQFELERQVNSDPKLAVLFKANFDKFEVTMKAIEHKIQAIDTQAVVLN